jgi:hypothetical protein
MSDTATLWGGAGTGRRVFEYTVGEDREWDARLLRWDVLGSLGHIEGLRAARLITPAEYLLLRTACERFSPPSPPADFSSTSDTL